MTATERILFDVKAFDQDYLEQLWKKYDYDTALEIMRAAYVYQNTFGNIEDARAYAEMPYNVCLGETE